MRSAVPRVLLGIFVTAATAVAQPQAVTVVGTIEATVNGEPRSWYQIELGSGDSATPMSSWARVMPTIYDVTIQGFVEERFVLEGALAISLSLSGGLPSDCPCRYDENTASILFLIGGSMTDSMYVSYEGGDVAVVIDVFEPAGDETYRVEGSFEGTLPFVADPGAGPDLDDVVDIEGTFDIARLPRETY